MKIVVTGDTRGDHAELKGRAGDVLIHWGDFYLGGRGAAEVLKDLDAWFGRQSFRHISRSTPACGWHTRRIATFCAPMASIWKHPVSVESLTKIHRGTAPEHLGIEFIEVGDDFIKARIPVDERTRQPYGILHGGISVVLAETLGSCGAASACPPGHRAVGLEVNANHLRSTGSGWVIGTARPLHVGRTTHVWQIELVNEAGQPTCISRITMAILPPRE